MILKNNDNQITNANLCQKGKKNLVKSKKKIFVKKQKKKKSQQIVITGIIVMHIKNV